MLEIEFKWFVVQLINFLLLIFLLNRLLFRPFLRIFQERKKRTSGYLDDAKNMDGERDGLVHQIEARLSDARGRAREIFEEQSRDGMTEQRKAITAASEEAQEISSRAKEDIEREARKTTQNLRAEVEAFSKSIVEKLIRV